MGRKSKSNKVTVRVQPRRNPPRGTLKVSGSRVKKGPARPQMGLAAVDSLYLQTIIDPVGVQGVKIPDEVTTPSCPAHGVDIQALTVNAQGLCGIAYQVGSEGTVTDVFTVGAAGTAAALAWTAGTKSFASSLVTAFSATRPVSALLEGQYQGSPLNQKGRCTACYIPGPMAGAGMAAATFGPQTLAGFLDQPYVETIAASKGYAECRYIPPDVDAFRYCDTGVNPARIRGIAAPPQSQYGVLVMIWDGCTVGDAIETNYYENLECLPQAGASSFITMTTPSYSDPIERSVVINALADNPEVAVRQVPAHIVSGSADSSNLGNKGRRGGHRMVPHNKGSGSGTPFLDSVLGFGKSILSNKHVQKAAGAIPVIGGALEAMLGWFS